MNLYFLSFLVVYIVKYNLLITIYQIFSNIANNINLTSLALIQIVIASILLAF